MAATVSNHGSSASGDSRTWKAVLPYLPNLLVDTVRRHPRRTPPWIDPVEGTLVLADISGFTPLSERLAQAGKEGAEWLTNIINQYFRRMLDIASEHDYDNARFGGDALLLLFTGEHHELRAVATALAMQRATSRFTTFHVGQHRVRLRMTVAAHSSTFWSAAAGLPGQRMQHFILGPEASRVAQVQSAASAGEFLITDDTLKRLGGLCVTTPHKNAHQVVRLRKKIRPRSREASEGAETQLPHGELLAYLPPPIARALQSGQINAIEPEHRKISIIFISLNGVNDVLQEQGPEVLLDELQCYMSSLVRLTDQYGGFLVDNDIHGKGLKLIVIFGAPTAHEQDSANALRLALEMQHEPSDLKLHLSHQIGVHTGFVFAGEVGAPYRRVYTVMGDAVNLTARLMASCSPGQILISKSVAGQAGPGFVVDELPPIAVKGKKQPVGVCSLRGEQAATTHTERPPEALVGRKAEIEMLSKLCREVERGAGRTLAVSGEAGMGKSRLVLEMQNDVRSRGWEVLQGTCYSHTAARPFAPWVSALSSFFGISPDDDMATRTKKVKLTVKRLRPSRLEFASLLNPLLGLSLPQGDVVRSLDEESRRRRLFELISGLLRDRAAETPLALLMEDLDHADRSSLQLIEHVAGDLDSSCVLLCLTYRPQMDKELHLPSESSVTIVLSELTQSASLDLILETLKRQNLPPQVAQAILAKTKGNPLFLQEVAHSMHESGTLDHLLESPTFKLADQMSNLSIPDRIHTLIMSRVDMLDQTSRDLLRSASIIGSSFRFSELSSLVGPDRTTRLEDFLKEIERRDLAYREPGTGEPTYWFRHNLVQEVIYDSLAFARRRQLHHRFATYLEEANAERPAAVYELLVHHYGRTADHGKTRYFAVRAAEKARRLFGHDEAIAYYRRGLETVDVKGAAGLWLRSYFEECIGSCYEVSGRHEDAARSLRRSLRKWQSAVRHGPTLTTEPPEFAAETPPEIRKALLCHKLSVSLERNSDYDASLKWLETAMKALPPRQPLQEARIYISKSVALFRKALYEEAIQCGRRGLALAKRTGDAGQVAYSNDMLASSYLELGQLRQAIRYRELAIQLYDTLGDLSGQATAHNNLGACYQLLGNLDKAFAHYQIALDTEERIGNPTAVAIAHNNIGEVLLTRGSVEGAISHLQKVVETYERTGDPLAATGLALINLSRAYQCLGQYEKAHESLKSGRSLLQKAGASGLLMEALVQQAELELDQGRIDQASITCQRALRETKETGTKLLEARALRVMGLINAAFNRRDEAEAQLLKSADLAKRLSADYEKGLALLCLAELHGRSAADQGSKRHSRQFLKKAIAVFRSMGAEGELARAHQLQTKLGIQQLEPPARPHPRLEGTV